VRRGKGAKRWYACVIGLPVDLTGLVAKDVASSAHAERSFCTIPSSAGSMPRTGVMGSCVKRWAPGTRLIYPRSRRIEARPI